VPVDPQGLLHPTAVVLLRQAGTGELRIEVNNEVLFEATSDLLAESGTVLFHLDSGEALRISTTQHWNRSGFVLALDDDTTVPDLLAYGHGLWEARCRSEQRARVLRDAWRGKTREAPLADPPEDLVRSLALAHVPFTYELSVPAAWNYKAGSTVEESPSSSVHSPVRKDLWETSSPLRKPMRAAGAQVTFFQIVTIVRDRSTGAELARASCRRRFADFDELDLRTRSMFRAGGTVFLGSTGHSYCAQCLASLPVLPPKFIKAMQDHEDPDFVESRRLTLEAYLSDLLRADAPHSLLVHMSPDLAAFLDLALFHDVLAGTNPDPDRGSMGPDPAPADKNKSGPGPGQAGAGAGREHASSSG